MTDKTDTYHRIIRLTHTIRDLEGAMLSLGINHPQAREVIRQELEATRAKLSWEVAKSEQMGWTT